MPLTVTSWSAEPPELSAFAEIFVHNERERERDRERDTERESKRGEEKGGRILRRVCGCVYIQIIYIYNYIYTHNRNSG